MGGINFENLANIIEPFTGQIPEPNGGGIIGEIKNTLGSITENFGKGVGTGLAGNTLQVNTKIDLPIQQILIALGLIGVLLFILLRKK